MLRTSVRLFAVARLRMCALHTCCKQLLHWIYSSEIHEISGRVGSAICAVVLILINLFSDCGGVLFSKCPKCCQCSLTLLKWVTLV